MADGVPITAGSGTTISTDDTADGHRQRVKLGIGADGSLVMIGHAEDSAHASGDGGIMSLAVRADTPTASGADGDYVPLLVDDSGYLYVSLKAFSGQLTQFNRLAAGAITPYYSVTASGIVVSGPCIFYGLKVLSAGSSIIVYDNTAASGQTIIPSTSTTAIGTTMAPSASHACGVLMNNGVYASLTGGGTFLFFIAPAV